MYLPDPSCALPNRRRGPILVQQILSRTKRLMIGWIQPKAADRTLESGKADFVAFHGCSPTYSHISSAADELRRCFMLSAEFLLPSAECR